MYDHILFPTDGSDGADAVFAHVLDIATRHGATVHILNVADTTRDSVTRIGGGVVDALAREGERIVDETADRATARSVSTVTDVRQGGVSETIAAYAEEYQASRTVESAAETAGAAGVDSVVETTEESDSVPEAVAAYTRTRDVDLVVMGTRGRSNLGQRILGSTTEQTVRTVPVPVLTVSESGSTDTSP